MTSLKKCLWFLYYIKQVDSMLPCICLVKIIHHTCRYHQNVVKTSATHSPNGSCVTFLFLPHLTSSLNVAKCNLG